MRHHAVARILCGIFLCLGSQVRAATVIDLNPDHPTPIAPPPLVEGDASPVYITNTKADAGSQTGVDQLRVGAASSLHLGYDKTNVAASRVGLNVGDSMLVEGRVHLGKGAGGGALQPEGASARGTSLAVGGALKIADGGSMNVYGAADEINGESGHSALSAASVVLDGGSLRLGQFSTLGTASADAAESVVVRNGGALTLDSGLPPDDESEWTFKGIAAGGSGVLIDNRGILATGAAGGVVSGVGGTERLRVARGGVLDLSAGNLVVRGMAGVEVNGGYHVGLAGGSSTRLVNESGNIAFAEDADISLDRHLARFLNNGGATAGNAVIASGRQIHLGPGLPSRINTGMGLYTLGQASATTETAPGEFTTVSQLRVTGVERAVTGGGDADDRKRFRQNMEETWSGRMRSDQANVIYNLAAAEYPTVEAVGLEGELNRDVIGALVSGRGAPVGDRGTADRGLYELYGGSTTWGVNSVAFNTAGLLMAGMDRRVHRLGAEMDRISAYAGSTLANASLPDQDSHANRVWVGAFGAADEAGLAYGVAGYKYRPRGIVLGYDRTFDRLSFGAAGAYAKGDYRDKAATNNDSEITSWSGGLYAAYHGPTGFNASAFATYSHLENELSDLRGGMRRRADYSSRAWSLGARAGYDMSLGERTLVQTSAGLVRVRAASRAHTEHLDGTRVMRVGQVTRDATMLPLEMTVGHDVLRGPGGVLRLSGTLGYAYDFDDSGLSGSFSYEGLTGASAMRVGQRKAGRHRWNLGTGVLFSSGIFDVTARYDYFRSSEQRTHQAEGSVGLKF